MEFGKIRKLDMCSYHFKYSGMDFQGNEHECKVSMTSYLQGVDTEKLFRKFKISRKGVGATSSCTEKDLELKEDEVPDMSLKEVYMTVVGCLGWGERLSPFRRVWYDILSKYTPTPTKRHLNIAVRILNAIKNDPEGLNLRRLSRSGLLKMVFFVDSSFERERYSGRHA